MGDESNELEEFKGTFIRNYYKAHNPATGALPLDSASEHIAAGIGGGEYKPVIKTHILEAPNPEDFRETAILLSAEVINDNGLVFLWTVGDKEFQQAKLQRGAFRARIGEKLQDRTRIDTHYAEHIYEENKMDGLSELITFCEKGGITDLYIADDNGETIEKVRNLSFAHEVAKKKAQLEDKPVSNLTIHNFQIKPDYDPLGNFDAFAQKVRSEMRQNKEQGLQKRFALILDVDETVMHTSRQLERAAVNTFSSIKKAA